MPKAQAGSRCANTSTCRQGDKAQVHRDSGALVLGTSQNLPYVSSSLCPSESFVLSFNKLGDVSSSLSSASHSINVTHHKEGPWEL